MRNWGPGHSNWRQAVDEAVLRAAAKEIEQHVEQTCKSLDALVDAFSESSFEPDASASWLTSDSPENHAEDQKCRSCKGTGRMLDDGPFTYATKIGPAPTCWSCGGTKRAR